MTYDMQNTVFPTKVLKVIPVVNLGAASTMNASLFSALKFTSYVNFEVPLASVCKLSKKRM